MSLWVVFPREVPEFPAEVGLGVGDGPAPTSQPEVARTRRRRRSSSSRCRAGRRSSPCSSHSTLRPGRTWGVLPQLYCNGSMVVPLSPLGAGSWTVWVMLAPAPMLQRPQVRRRRTSRGRERTRRRLPSRTFVATENYSCDFGPFHIWTSTCAGFPAPCVRHWGTDG